MYKNIVSTWFIILYFLEHDTVFDYFVGNLFQLIQNDNIFFVLRVCRHFSNARRNLVQDPESPTKTRQKIFMHVMKPRINSTGPSYFKRARQGCQRNPHSIVSAWNNTQNQNILVNLFEISLEFVVYFCNTQLIFLNV